MTQFGTKSQDGWRTFRLEELVANPKADIVDGPFGSNLKASEYKDEGIPIARLQNVDPNTFVRKNIRFVSAQKAAELSRHNFRAGDLLITKLGDPLGEACIVPADIERGVIVADLVRVRLDPRRCVKEAVCYAINSTEAQAQFKRETKGTTRPRVNLGMVRSLCLPLPERLDEQQHIVADIEKQFTRLDSGVASLKRVQAALKRYRASMLKAACEGHLVPTEAELARKENRSCETGEELLHRILKERRERWNGKGKYKEPLSAKIVDLPPLPEGWSWARLEELGFVVGGLTKNPVRSKLATQLPYLRVANVYASELRLDSVETIGVKDSELEKLLLRRSDLLIVEGNGSKEQIGRLAIWDGSIEPCVHQNHIIKVRLIEPKMAQWILHWLLSSGGRDYVELVASSTSGLYTLSIKKVADLPVPTPPLAEQVRIVTSVQRRLSIVEAIRKLLSAEFARAASLRAAILNRAFRCSVDWIG